ncbi:MAG: hypothetical protein R6V75_09020 [Bacteroidales bacterium]
MKKQIFVLIIALVAGSTLAFGQLTSAVKNSDPRGLLCTDNAASPIAGKPYWYRAAADPSGGNFTFWATKDFNFIQTAAGVTTTNINTRLTTPDELIATSANYAVPNVQDSVMITWSDATLSATVPGTSPTFVAVHYAAPAGDCADNFKVWELAPIKAFTVDIKNIVDATGAILDYNLATDQCTDIVRGAQYSGGSIQYNYGADTLFFEVIAANFTVSWTPTFEVLGMHTVQTAVVEWTYDPPASWGATTTWNAGNTTVLTNETNTSVGVSIYARVIVQNNNFENINGIDITLAVDGTNSLGDWDIVNNLADGSGPLCDTATGPDQMDIAMQTIKPRPTVTPVNPPTFVPGNEQN